MGLFRPQTEGEAQASAAAQALQTDELARQNQNGTGIQQGLEPAGPPRPPAFEPGPDLRGTVPPIHPGGGNFTEFDDDFTKGQVDRAAADEAIFGGVPKGPSRGPSGEVQGEGENFLPTGGREEFEQTYREGPKRLAEAQAEIGRLSGNRSEAMGEQYRQSAQQAQEAMAANKSRRADDDQQIAIRQQQLDKAVTHYSNDLADQGKFWSSGGNIISAIAFSLMPIFSNDPTIGVKLINQAIDRDMANRKDLANMHLGELRSNLGNYRKLAEDHNVGDQIAQSEAHRVAAMEIERIANTFESPIAKAKAQAMIEDQLMRAGQTRQTAFNHYNYNTVRALDPRVARAFEAPGKAGNTDAWKSFTLPPDGPGKGVQGAVSGTPSVASTVPTPPSLAKIPPTQMAALTHSPGEVAKMGLGGRIDQAGLVAMYSRITAKRADRLVNLNPGDPGYAVKYNEQMKIMRKEANDGVAAIAKSAQPFQVGMAVTTRIQRDMDLIENEMRQANPKVNMTTDFLGNGRAVVGGALMSRINDLQNRFDAGDTAAGRNADALRQASERFHQAMAGKIIGYYHDQAGAAQSPSELANLGQVISSKDSWEKMRSFVHEESRNYAQQIKGAIASSGDPISAVLYMAQNGNGTPMLSSRGISAPITRTGNTARGKDAPGPPAYKDEFVP